ncbi:MAG: S-formylglutathione hydrolase [Rhodospirillales bacterium]|nr:S-formylglutathione hydrolase [Rhodospirillales bacterium]
MALDTVSKNRCYGGTQGIYSHRSAEIGLPMRFAVYEPPAAANGKVPLLIYLSGLTCTEENFTIKAGAQRLASEHGMIVVAPDTSPRSTGIDGEDDDWAFGTGAGFYLDATVEPWSRHYRMESYIVKELPKVICENFPADGGRMSVFGHSMGGHGAISLALKNPGMYQSVSAFAPMNSLMNCEPGVNALTGYLGDDRDAWRRYDVVDLIESGHRCPPLLVDQGSIDEFLPNLLPEKLQAACDAAGQPLTLNMREGYDHSYWFVQSFMADHFAHHAEVLCG